MARYRKKPVEIEAIQYTGVGVGWFRVQQWLNSLDGGDLIAQHFDGHLTIPTLEGKMRADVGDWIIRGVQGEFYPCKPDIFEATYEPVDGGDQS